MGGSRRWWVGWEAEGRLWLPLENSTGSSAVSSVRDRNRHNPQVRQRWLLAVHSLAPLKSLLMPSRGFIDSVYSAPLWFHRVGKKPSVKTYLAILSHVLGTSR